MKILIWGGLIFTASAIPTVLRMNGIFLGAIPTMLIFGAALFLAGTLCKLWDNHRNEKEARANKAEQEARLICKHCGAKLSVMSRVCPQCGQLSDEIG